MTRYLTLLALLTLTACSTPEPTGAPEAPATAPEVPNLDLASLKERSNNMALVPSVIETQKALDAAGIGTQLNTLIVSKTYDMSTKESDRIAIRTGVILADLLLVVKTAKIPAIISRLADIQSGMNALGGGKDIDATILDIIERLKGEALKPAELLQELDELSGAIIPELNFNGQTRIVPLIQAGSWLEGANLVAKALQKTEGGGEADGILKQPAVVEYFIGYVKTEGAKKAPEAVTNKLEESLTTLKGIASKSEALSKEDIASIVQTTNDVLSLL